jgi:hypothetical protein
VCAFAAALLALMAVAFPSSASAQLNCINCPSNAIRVYATDDIPCSVPICVAGGPTGIVVCDKVKPGTEIKLPCLHGATIYITSCDGVKVPVTTACTPDIPLGNGCCVHACLFEDGAGCYIVKIGRSLQNCGCNTD